MGRINELRLISRVAQMYYSEHKRQAEIAEHLHLSQATVSRMLKRAEAEGIVRTSIIPLSEPSASWKRSFVNVSTCLKSSSSIAAKTVTGRSWRGSAKRQRIFWKLPFRKMNYRRVQLEPNHLSKWSKTSSVERCESQIHCPDTWRHGRSIVQTHATQIPLALRG